MIERESEIERVRRRERERERVWARAWHERLEEAGRWGGGSWGSVFRVERE